ncbi:MAG TPA: hypothetical protein PLZ43_01925, partial [bacterium]|nr:hypothetical protein [bacterium]
ESKRSFGSYSGKLSEKQTALLNKHGDAKIKECLQKGDMAACQKWIDDFFKKLDEKKKAKK